MYLPFDCRLSIKYYHLAPCSDMMSEKYKYICRIIHTRFHQKCDLKYIIAQAKLMRKQTIWHGFQTAHGIEWNRCFQNNRTTKIQILKRVVCDKRIEFSIMKECYQDTVTLKIQMFLLWWWQNCYAFFPFHEREKTRKCHTNNIWQNGENKVVYNGMRSLPIFLIFRMISALMN